MNTTDEKTARSIHSDVSATVFCCLDQFMTSLVYVFYRIRARSEDRGEE